jgi:hypothetical protein
MNRFAKYAAPALLLAVLTGQLIQPDTTNPPVSPNRTLWEDHHVDPRVAGILRRSCADCHSHETRWPWYSRISPISWMVARHVVKGRAKLNFSDWSGASEDQIEEIYDSTAKHKMPMSSYLLMHPQARLSKEDRDVLMAWADGKLTNRTDPTFAQPK